MISIEKREFNHGSVKRTGPDKNVCRVTLVCASGLTSPQVDRENTDHGAMGNKPQVLHDNITHFSHISGQHRCCWPRRWLHFFRNSYISRGLWLAELSPEEISGPTKLISAQQHFGYSMQQSYLLCMSIHMGMCVIVYTNACMQVCCEVFIFYFSFSFAFLSYYYFRCL